MNSEQAVSVIDDMLKVCTSSYLGINKSNENNLAISIAVEFVRSKFGHLGINEINEAFSMAAANSFDGIEMKAYFGNFSIAMLGDILKAYSDYRNNVLKAMLEAEEKQAKEAKEEAEKEQKNKEARELAISEIKEAIEGNVKWSDWRKIPQNYVHIGLDNGLFEFDEDFKKQCWIEAQKVEKEELQLKSENVSRFIEASQAKKDLTAIASGKLPDGFIDAAKVHYSKLLIWNYVSRI